MDGCSPYSVFGSVLAPFRLVRSGADSGISKEVIAGHHHQDREEGAAAAGASSPPISRGGLTNGGDDSKKKSASRVESMHSAVATDVTEDPTSSLEQKNNTIVNGIPSKDETDYPLTAKKNEAVDPYNATIEEIKLAKDGKAEEKVAMPIDQNPELQGIGSRDQVDVLSNGGSKLEEAIYGTSGKSSSTKTITEESYRLSRTNGLTAITAKPASNETKVDEMRNKTAVEVQLSNDSLTQEPSKNVAKFLEGGSGLKEEREGRETSSDSMLKAGTTFNSDSESAPQKIRLEELQDRKKKTEGPVKNAEVPDLKEADGEKDESISLINDTYVNYSHRKLSTEPSDEVDSSNRSLGGGNATNFITREIPVTHQSRHPKEEVEVVVENVTRPAIQRIVETPVNATPKDVDELKPTLIENVETNREIDQRSTKNTTDSSTVRPYPYVKSANRESFNTSSQLPVTTEEASALENTIGKGQSEEKFIVTEASDVLENSIQQFRPAYDKTGNESSTTSSAEVRSTASLVRLEEATPTNEMNVMKLERSTSAGNDVPRWSESREIAGTRSVDVTGNGIMEVSAKPESVERTFHETTSQVTPTLTTESSTDPAILSSVDVRQGSLLTRSTLNASELPTGYTLIMKGNSSDRKSPSTAPTDTSTESNAALLATTVEETSLGNVTESPASPETNGTNEIPSGSAGGTLSPDETFLPTTTGVEFEFVGLSESTAFVSRNVTEQPAEGRELPSEIVPTVKDLLTRNASNENDESTTSNESTTEDSSLSSETDTPLTDRTLVPLSIPRPTQSKDELTTRSSITVNNEVGETERISTKVDEARKTIDVTDSWSTTSDEDAATTVRVEQSITKDSRFTVNNVTEVPVVEFTSTSDDATRVETSSLPFTPVSLGPKVAVSSSTGSPTIADVSTVKTYGTKVLPSQEEITCWVRIDIEGNSYDVCSKMGKLRVTLAEILTDSMKKPVSDEQIIFHQNPCQELTSPTPSSDMPLTSICIYVVDENGKFDSDMTKSLPSLYEKSQEHIKFPVKIHRFLLVQETVPDSGNAIAVVVVSSVALICLILLAGLLFIMRKRQTRFNYGERCRPVSLDAYSLDSVSAYNSVRRKDVARSSKRSYGNPTFEDSSAIPSHPLNFAALSSFCNDVNAINEEFAGIPQVSAKIDELPTGAEVKNRYANVIPLPETRVLLQKINNDPFTEYINASYVRGPKNATKYYIACQAPMESTVTDFWRMIWEQQCKVIIMLTDLVENGVEKCTEYIPPSEVTDCRRLYGDFQVTLKKRETKEKYAISTLHLNNLEKNTFREVYHIWYLWPVNGVQSDGAGLIAVLLEARALQRGGPGPIVVHCSPGTGRTGTLIALDLGIRQYEITRTVDVPRVVYTIRRDRAGAVKTKEQYAFIYKVIGFLKLPCPQVPCFFRSFALLFRLVDTLRGNRAIAS
ncbi:Receptor-type tyrosine-protein phosphatase kappa [Melipona quadrifasciata]|uniref:protein-tyrosine-phosphatase n=1 Tax=Melipona quadrifasciata TaxID=166423 RepID=A0A0N0BC88_9HYME|nr:Receptor-type tyrosine-protein phosphatase kappa [Melipona quadrifasciata]